MFHFAKLAFAHLFATRSKSLMIMGALGLALLLAAPQASHAQQKVQGSYGDWQYVCDIPPGSPSEDCYLIQSVVDGERPNVGLSVIVFNPADGQNMILRVIAPLGVLLPTGLGLYVDETNIGSTPFVRCTEEYGCVTDVILDESLLNLMKNGKLATFSIYQTPELGIGLPITLNAFSEGIARVQSN
jgi:invasion protein IalB